ncbi:MAG: NAD(+)/NADH kinase [Acidobacteriota bacterium]
MPNEIKTAGLIAKPRSDRAIKLIPELIAWLKARGVKVRLDEDAAKYAKRKDGVSREKAAAGSDLLIVLGGDGTLLSAARATLARPANGRILPIFAVNLGSLGFLTAIKADDVFDQLEPVLRGDYQVTKRRMLRTELWRGTARMAVHEALNDMVLSKSDLARMIDLEVFVDHHFVCVYKADGLIISTPTGSTAYSLSAGGPIMIPSVDALAITPICPHMLTNRPVIVPDESEIQVTVRGRGGIHLTIDGQVGESLKGGDKIVCRRGDHSIALVQPPGSAFFDVLREKLKWGGR